jgi:hypothetical protein
VAGPDIAFSPDSDDLLIENGDLVIRRNVAQSLRFRLRFFTKDWFLDPAAGIPYFDEILKKRPNLAYVEQLLQREILDTEGVLELLEFQLSLSAQRQLSVSFRARTVEDDVNLVVGLNA